MWRARGLHVRYFWAGSATTAIPAFLLLLMWSVTWTPFTFDVDCERCDVWSDVEVFVRPVLGMADVHWDSATSRGTFRWTCIFPFGILQCYALFMVDGLCGSILSIMASYWTQDNLSWLWWWWIFLGLHPIWQPELPEDFLGGCGHDIVTESNKGVKHIYSNLKEQ